MAAGLDAAAREDKRLIVQVGGPGCAPCLLLARYFHQQRELIGKDYLIVKLDSRMVHFDDVVNRLRPAADRSIPWMAILSAGGDRLATSDIVGQNIGYPGSGPGRPHFESMLRGTRQRLTDQDLDTLLRALGR